ncbi:MAG: hypothetical protein Q7R60_00485 [bacterium]|nr:hypothetical protein [bacterium]
MTHTESSWHPTLEEPDHIDVVPLEGQYLSGIDAAVKVSRIARGLERHLPTAEDYANVRAFREAMQAQTLDDQVNGRWDSFSGEV